MANEWVSTILGNLINAGEAHLQTGPFGTALKAAEYSANGVPLISVREIREGHFEVGDDTPRVSEETTKRLPKFLLEEGDIVFGRKGGIDRNARVDRRQQGWFLGSDGIRLRLSKKHNSQFFSYQMRNPANRAWLLQNCEGSTMPSLNQEILGRVPIVIPPPIEQQAIACVLGALDDKIELNRRRNGTLEAMARALFQSWFVDFDPVRAKAEGRAPAGLSKEVAKLFPAALEDSPLGPIPKGWRVASLGDCVTKVAMGPFGSNIKTDNFVNEGVPVIRGSNLTDGFVDEDFVHLLDVKADELRNANAFPGDVVITHRGTLGQVGLIPAKARHSRYVVSQSQMFVRPDPEQLPSHFLYLFLTSDKGQHALLANTSQTGVPAIAQPTSSVKAVRVVCPDKPVVAMFETVVGNTFAAVNHNQQHSRTLASLRDALLLKLISGELRVPDAERIVGRVS